MFSFLLQHKLYFIAHETTPLRDAQSPVYILAYFYDRNAGCVYSAWIL